MTDLERELLALLDLIEVSGDSTLPSQRHDIMIKHGYTFHLGQPVSGKVQ